MWVRGGFVVALSGMGRVPFLSFLVLEINHHSAEDICFHSFSCVCSMLRKTERKFHDPGVLTVILFNAVQAVNRGREVVSNHRTLHHY